MVLTVDANKVLKANSRRKLIKSILIRANGFAFLRSYSFGRLGAHITVHRTGDARQGPLQQGGLHRQIPADTRRARRSSEGRGPVGGGSCVRERRQVCAGATVSPRAQGGREREREVTFILISIVSSDSFFVYAVPLYALYVHVHRFHFAALVACFFFLLAC